MNQCCGNCGWFTAGKPIPVYAPAGYLYHGSPAKSVQGNPETIPGKCLWVSPHKLPFWLWKKCRPLPIDGDDCKVWKARAAEAEEE